MIRAVVDTNVLVSALIKPGGSLGKILRNLRDGDFSLLYTRATLNELVDVLNRPRLRYKYGLTVEDIQTVAALILLRGEAVTPVKRIQVCRDPKDDKFLEAAAAGGADLIVSGDRDLLVLSQYEGIPIVSPREFIQQMESDG